MPEDHPIAPDAQPEPEPGRFGYTACEKWEYRQIICKTPHKQSWRDMADSFFRAAILLVQGVAKGELRDDIEGLAAIFLFRHYLELILKSIILNGRWLVRVDENAREGVQEVKRIHELQKLWEWVIKDAKPKLNPGDWENYDTEFVEKCIAEFDEVDKKGFAFRYAGRGGEFCLFDFHALANEMEHIQQILDGINVYLVEAHAQNAEWEAYLESEFRGDMY
jgi:hypothetical protein